MTYKRYIEINACGGSVELYQLDRDSYYYNSGRIGISTNDDCGNGSAWHLDANECRQLALALMRAANDIDEKPNKANDD
jgi:hypothetical protein